MSEVRPARMFLATLGSRGDVEPFLCLARAARDAGHQVRLAVPDSAEIDTRGLGQVPGGGVAVILRFVGQKGGSSPFWSRLGSSWSGWLPR